MSSNFHFKYVRARIKKGVQLLRARHRKRDIISCYKYGHGKGKEKEGGGGSRVRANIFPREEEEFVSATRKMRVLPLRPTGKWAFALFTWTFVREDLGFPGVSI